ncbi:MAG: FRG domain-containing protein [Spirochaetia bacterium]|nr:FRG domain-containing protein [Spirochaetia bacterium]
MKNEIYSDIFEVIKKIQPDNPILSYKDYKGQLNRIKTITPMYCYNLINNNGKVIAYPGSPFNSDYFRGEHELYKHCYASIYRNNTNITKNLQLIIDKIKLLDFKDTLLTIPKIQEALQQNRLIDFNALAQHYGLRTEYVDLTTELLISVFFATHSYNEGIYSPVGEKYGIIRHHIISPFSNIIEEFGEQPFKRPGFQAAFAKKLNEEEDFNQLNFSNRKYIFKQNINYSSIINKLFFNHKNECILFPKEEITDFSNEVKNSKQLSEKNFIKYCKENHFDLDKTKSLINSIGFIVSKNHPYSFTPEEKDIYDFSLYQNSRYVTRVVRYGN